MQVIVKKEFVDIHTKKLHQVGETFEVTDKRLAEIQKVDKNMVQVVEETPAPVSSTTENSKENKKGMKKNG